MTLVSKYVEDLNQENKLENTNITRIKLYFVSRQKNKYHT